MRKFVRNQILDLLPTIWEGVKQAKTLDPQAAEAVLTDCYIAIQTVEQTIRAGISENTFLKYNALLNSIKDLLEEVNIGIAQSVSISDSTKKLKNALKQLRKQLQDEMEIQIEVVFMPYNVSMWDALESVWQAAKQDERCDTYVVPLPYYERKPDHQLGAFHYEGDLYPPDVPVTHYEQYDLEVHRPDIVYIHYPYDDCNYVTSVDPRYYTTELKKYAGFLIYIPYFISYNNVEKNYCICPGVLNADRVIVQSEKIRSEYIAYLLEFEKSNQCKGKFSNFNEKIVALGSPKMDKVISSKRERVQIPEAWKHKIYRADGTKRHVVFYNTSIECLLKENENILYKLRTVFEFFRNLDDAVLLWRPHPLNEATYKSMRPQLYREYCSIIEDYKSLGYGIFDNTPDMNRAIAVADAYYGEWGSALTVSLSAGKPALLQSIEIQEDNMGIFLPYAAKVCGDHIFMAPFAGHILLKYNLLEGKVEKVLETAEDFKKHLYMSVEHIDNNIVFIPYAANKILICNENMDKINYVCLPQPPCDFIGNAYFQRSIVFGQKVYMFGFSYPGIVQLDPSSGETSLAVNMADLLKESYKKQESPVFFDACPCIHQNAIYTTVRQYTASDKWNVALLRFEPETGRTDIVPLETGKDNLICSCITSTGKYLWISFSNSGTLIFCNPENWKSERIELPMLAVRKTFYRNGRLYVIRLNGKDSCYVLREKGEKEPFSLASSSDVLCVTEEEDGTVMMLLKNDCAIKMRFDETDAEMEYHRFNWGEHWKTLTANPFRTAMEHACMSGVASDFLFNESFFCLSDFVSNIDILAQYGEKQSQVYRNRFANSDGTAGEKIHQYVQSEFRRMKIKKIH